MRTLLAPYATGGPHRFRARFARHARLGKYLRVSLLKDLRDEAGEFLCDHVWAQFDLPLVVPEAARGVELGLVATVAPYRRRNGELDYHLAAVEETRPMPETTARELQVTYTAGRQRKLYLNTAARDTLGDPPYVIVRHHPHSKRLHLIPAREPGPETRALSRVNPWQSSISFTGFARAIGLLDKPTTRLPVRWFGGELVADLTPLLQPKEEPVPESTHDQKRIHYRGMPGGATGYAKSANGSIPVAPELYDAWQRYRKGSNLHPYEIEVKAFVAAFQAGGALSGAIVHEQHKLIGEARVEGYNSAFNQAVEAIRTLGIEGIYATDFGTATDENIGELVEALVEKLTTPKDTPRDIPALLKELGEAYAEFQAFASDHAAIHERAEALAAENARLQQQSERLAMIRAALADVA